MLNPTLLTFDKCLASMLMKAQVFPKDPVSTIFRTSNNKLLPQHN
ncbi:hypothetical protein GGD38_005961 [Chitinophagaceae bacterium OAS944]|nr:hypothetical protein [Chitinophagaceae bacterium OAS944]